MEFSLQKIGLNRQYACILISTRDFYQRMPSPVLILAGIFYLVFVFILRLGVGAIPVLTWLPVLRCAIIWILLYRGYRYIFMYFIGWTDKDFFLRGHYCIIREREMPVWLDINQNRMVFPPNIRSAFKYILADLYSGAAHKLDYNNFPKCNLCKNITKSVNGCKR